MLAPEKKLISVARIAKSFGQNGEVIMRYSPAFEEDIDQKEPVFICFDELPVPFFITSITNRGNRNVLVKFETISNRKMAEELTGTFVYIDSKRIQNNNIDNELESIAGYTVHDSTLGIVGSVSQIYPYPNNPCLGIMPEDRSKEHLLPFHKDIINSIDHLKQLIEITAPKGVFDMTTTQ